MIRPRGSLLNCQPRTNSSRLLESIIVAGGDATFLSTTSQELVSPSQCNLEVISLLSRTFQFPTSPRCWQLEWHMANLRSISLKSLRHLASSPPPYLYKSYYGTRNIPVRYCLNGGQIISYTTLGNSDSPVLRPIIQVHKIWRTIQRATS
jgi:hypothetical protein